MTLSGVFTLASCAESTASCSILSRERVSLKYPASPRITSCAHGSLPMRVQSGNTGTLVIGVPGMNAWSSTAVHCTSNCRAPSLSQLPLMPTVALSGCQTMPTTPGPLGWISTYSSLVPRAIAPTSKAASEVLTNVACRSSAARAFKYYSLMGDGRGSPRERHACEDAFCAVIAKHFLAVLHGEVDIRLRRLVFVLAEPVTHARTDAKPASITR